MNDSKRHSTRRDFLRIAGAAAAGVLLGQGQRRPARAGEGPTPRKVPVGLQLYSVRGQCGKDGGKNLPNVIKAVAKMGYEGVEFAGYYGWNAPALKKRLDDNGIRCSETHTRIGTLLGDNLKKTVEFHKILGNKFLIVPILGGKYTADAEAWKQTAGLFNEIAGKLRPHGMYCGYHAHARDFKPVGDTTGWELFFDNTSKDVVMQLDTSNCLAGKGDPVALLRKYPGRSLTIHCKEYGGQGMGVIGEGQVNWPEVIKLGRTTAGARWFVIEHERGGADSLEAVDKCLANFRKLLAETR